VRRSSAATKPSQPVCVDCRREARSHDSTAKITDRWQLSRAHSGAPARVGDRFGPITKMRCPKSTVPSIRQPRRATLSGRCDSHDAERPTGAAQRVRRRPAARVPETRARQGAPMQQAQRHAMAPRVRSVADAMRARTTQWRRFIRRWQLSRVLCLSRRARSQRPSRVVGKKIALF
jgi:hypothetical protein